MTNDSNAGGTRVVRRWLTITLSAVILAVASALLVLKLLEMRIAGSFRAPETRVTLKHRAPPDAYDFTYRSLNGQLHKLSDAKGKVVFVNFWGTWCIRCVAEMPTIQRLYNTLKNDPQLVFVIASRLDTPARIRLYANYGHYDLPFYMVKDSDIPQQMQFNQYPTTFIFAKDGALAETQVGGADWNDASVVRFIRGLEDQQLHIQKAVQP